MAPLRTARSIWASSALMNRSTGAPLTICRESTLDPAKLNRTAAPPPWAYARLISSRQSERLIAAETVTEAGCPANPASRTEDRTAKAATVGDNLGNGSVDTTPRPPGHGRHSSAEGSVRRQLLAGFLGRRGRAGRGRPLARIR